MNIPTVRRPIHITRLSLHTHTRWRSGNQESRENYRLAVNVTGLSGWLLRDNNIAFIKVPCSAVWQPELCRRNLSLNRRNKLSMSQPSLFCLEGSNWAAPPKVVQPRWALNCDWSERRNSVELSCRLEQSDTQIQSHTFKEFFICSVSLLAPTSLCRVLVVFFPV